MGLAAAAGIAAVGAVAGGVIASSGAQSAAKTQASAADKAAQMQQAQYDQTRADYAPWRAAGQTALNQQTDLLGFNGTDAQTNAFSQFKADPGYQYDVDQAVQGVDRSAAARGLLTSGTTIKAIQDRASSLADQGYNNYFNRLAGVAGTGKTATAGTAAAGATAATNEGNDAIAAGNARASGYTNSATAINNGIGGAISAMNGGINNYFAYGAGNPDYTVPPVVGPQQSPVYNPTYTEGF